MDSLGHLFERVDMVYKTMAETPFPVAVLVPKGLRRARKTCPLLVHFHGGWLHMGTILDPVFVSKWPLELALVEGAIIVSPAYRLLPEATGSDILEDVKDFWTWVRTSLVSLIDETWPGLTVDLDKTAVLGESAGGFLSLQSAFLVPDARIKAVMAQYCGMFPDLAAFSTRKTPAPSEADAAIDAYTASIKPGAIRLLAPFPALIDMSAALQQTGRHREWQGNDERMTLTYGLRAAGKLPPMWIMQGTEDQFMPKDATDELVARIRKERPDVPLLYSVQPGGHGFDGPHGLKEPYIAEGIRFLESSWP